MSTASLNECFFNFPVPQNFNSVYPQTYLAAIMSNLSQIPLQSIPFILLTYVFI